MLPDTAGRDAAGRLVVGGCDVAALANEFGTPLYVFDEATLRGRLRAYRAGIDRWPAGGDVLYSCKAWLSTAMVRLLIEENCGIDTVSGGELEVALRAGLAAGRVGFPGNNKGADEVGMAARVGVGHLVIDSLHELKLIADLPAGSSVRGLLRVSPGIRPDTHDFISTGQLDSKFGFSIETGQAAEAVAQAGATPHLELRGLHMHIGSQIFDLGSYPAAVAIVADLCVHLRDEQGFTVAELSVGGGLGIAYTDADDPPTVADFMSVVSASVRAEFEQRSLPLPALLVEPGRSVAGPAALAIYRVGARKVIPGVRTYVAVDGGMADNIRPKLYGARYQALPVHVRNRPIETVTVAGRYCESTDILIKDAEIEHLDPGDLIALPAAGAYTLSMASNYNVAMRPAVVIVADGSARLVRRRETVDDWLALEAGIGVSV